MSFNDCPHTRVRPANSSPAMTERKRRRFNRKAFERMVALDLGDGTTSCEIIDISHGGARLRPLMCPPKALPERFTLLLSACGKVRRHCRVIWRSASELGVQFPDA
jgi:PilZ domain